MDKKVIEIHNINDEHLALLEEYDAKWEKIFMRTTPINKVKAEEALRALIKPLNINPEKVVFCDSPTAAMDQINMHIEKVDSIKKCKNPRWLDSSSSGRIGNFQAYESSFYDWFFDVIYPNYPDAREIDDAYARRWEVIKPVNQECHYYWILDDALFFSEFPMELHIIEDRLDNPNGPAISYKDKEALYYIKGIAVPSKYTKEIPKENYKDILAISNAEVRWAVISKIGMENLLDELGGKTIDTIGGVELYEKHPVGQWCQQGDVLIGVDEPAEAKLYDPERLSKVVYSVVVIPRNSHLNIGEQTYLVMTNPSTGEKHAEGVRNGIKTVYDALVFRNGGRKTLPYKIT